MRLLSTVVIHGYPFGGTFNDWRPITRADILWVVSAVRMTEGAGQVRWHRFDGSNIDHVERGGYRSSDNQWLIIRVSYRFATVWQAVNESEVCSEGPGYPWFIGDPDALVTNVEGQWFVNRWDSANIGDAKAEIAQSVGI